jgi:hypothetical protein
VATKSKTRSTQSGSQTPVRTKPSGARLESRDGARTKSGAEKIGRTLGTDSTRERSLFSVPHTDSVRVGKEITKRKNQRPNAARG